MNLNDILGPMNESDRIEYAIEALTVSVQLAIQKAMHEKSFTQKELAERLGVSPARVSQLLSASGPNLTLKVLGKIAYALGEEFELLSVKDITEMQKQHAKQIKDQKAPLGARSAIASSKWVDTTANDNRYPYLAAVA